MEEGRGLAGDDRMPMTIADIAKELGVSKSTVSRVISGKGRIGDETRNRVQSWIRRHNYIPNSTARALASNRTYNVAVVIPRDADRGDVPFFQDCLVGLAETFASRGYAAVLSVVDASDASSLENLVRNRKVDGAILTRLVENDASLDFLKDDALPFVVMGTSDEEGLYTVDSDNFAGCYELTKLLLGLGLRKLVFLAGSREHEVNLLRHKGFLEACEGEDVKPVLEEWDVETVQDVSRALERSVEQFPCCIVCTDDVICGKALAWLEKKGYSVPGDVKVASFYDSEALKTHVPPVTALSVSSWELCRTAGNALIDLVEEKSIDSRIPVGYQVKIRESTRV